MKDIKDYLPFYLGCQIFGSDYDNNCRKGYLTGVTNGGCDCEIQFFTDDGINVEEEPVYDEVKDIKLILRPLSIMTEDERKAFGCATGTSIGDMEMEAKRISYLLSKHFDLFGLIESGLAIDATALK